MNTITSLSHTIVKHALQIRENRDRREELKEILIQGKTMVKEIALKYPLLHLFVTSEEEIPKGIKAQNIWIVSEEILKKITGVPHPEPIAAIISYPEEGSILNKRWVVVLDHISDPGNLGTLIRSAHALGWEAVLIIEPSCDPYNDKALRSAKGSTFFIPIQRAHPDQIEKLIGQSKPHVWVADLDGEPVHALSDEGVHWLILGNETHGPDTCWKNHRTITIPLSRHADSLNVGVAGGILMHTLKPRIT